LTESGMAGIDAEIAAVMTDVARQVAETVKKA
jgi:hypothetical protein